ncbi:MAG TPA: hypothetical protein PLT33_14010, partial [Deltaproteobacteria bacterium]|nr:hypothetical protein [Deltaproteobacteria bacterium]HQO61966.1 hypothetical protein [Deltaproteobacteria bacterium]
LGRHLKKGGLMSSLVEMSRPRAQKLCSYINDIYQYIYLSDLFENFMGDRRLKIKESYKPYWD